MNETPSHPTLPARLLGIFGRLRSRWTIALVRGSGAEIAEGCEVGPHSDLVLGWAKPRRGTLQIGRDCSLGAHVVIHPYGGAVRLGEHVHVGPGSVIYGHGGVEIGAETLLGPNCLIFSSEHDVPPLGTPIRSRADLRKPTRIGRDVWLGADVKILGGITVGDGCVVGAGAVVTHDLPPGSIAAGVPARVQGQRAR